MPTKVQLVVCVHWTEVGGFRLIDFDGVELLYELRQGGFGLFVSYGGNGDVTWVAMFAGARVPGPEGTGPPRSSGNVLYLGRACCMLGMLSNPHKHAQQP